MKIELRDELRRRTGQARARHASAHGGVGPHGVGPDEIGPDEIGRVFVLAESAGHPVEWAVLEITSGGGRLAVPLDDQPLVGAHDVAVDVAVDEQRAGLRSPSVLRCAWAVELDARWLAAERRSGRLPPESVERALDKHRRLAAGDTGTAIGREVETEPEYRRWIEEVVRPARDAVLRAAEANRFLAARQDSSPPAPASQGSRASRRATRLWALAASVLLAVSCVLGWQVLRLHDAGVDERAAERRAERQASGELRRRNAELQKKLSTLERDRDELLEQLESTSAPDVDSAPRPAVDRALDALINVPLAVLVSGVRGEPEVVEVSAEQPWIGVVIELQPGQATPLSLDVTPLGGGESVFRSEGLEPSRGLLSLLLPSRQLPPAAYRLRLFGPGGGAENSLTFTLIVERP